MYDRRVIWKNNGVTTDITKNVTGPLSDSIVLDYKAADDRIFIGSVLPFNHLFFDFIVANNDAVTPTVKVWTGTQWTTVVDLQDETRGWFAPGKIMWSVPRETSWIRELDSFDAEGLEDTVIYNMYWAELSFSADLDALTDLKTVGQRFSDDSDLFSFYPDLSQTGLLEQFETGKTTWNEQSLAASEACIAYLKAKNIIKVDSQVMKPDQLKMAAIHKTAEIIYSAFGAAYKDDKIEARKDFEKAIDLKFLNVDENADGNLSLSERKIRTGRLYR